MSRVSLSYTGHQLPYCVAIARVSPSNPVLDAGYALEFWITSMPVDRSDIDN